MNVDMDKVIDVDLDVNGETVTVSSVLLGVPHTEVFIDDITKAPVTTQGPILENTMRSHPIQMLTTSK